MNCHTPHWNLNKFTFSLLSCRAFLSLGLSYLRSPLPPKNKDNANQSNRTAKTIYRSKGQQATQEIGQRKQHNVIRRSKRRLWLWQNEERLGRTLQAARRCNNVSRRSPPDDKPADSLIEEYTTLEDKRDDVIDTYKRTHQQQQIQASTGTDENSAAASHINTNQPTEDVANNNTEDENSTPDPPQLRTANEQHHSWLDHRKSRYSPSTEIQWNGACGSVYLHLQSTVNQ